MAQIESQISVTPPTRYHQLALGISVGMNELNRVIPMVVAHSSVTTTTTTESTGNGMTRSLRNTERFLRYNAATSRKGNMKEMAHTSSRLAPNTLYASLVKLAGLPKRPTSGTSR